ncbi:hypothetical protein D6783_02980 [Candidatus Woesearchaeota archaeon]|nr:MAG: hypothetical protein D6783_02980 [Candidatus Woesearchaeota archaeon]
MTPRAPRSSFSPNTLAIIAALFFLALLSSCSQPPTTPPIYQGREGVVFDFTPGRPPDEVFEGRSFVLSILAHNKGASSLNNNSFGIVKLGFDPRYLRLTRTLLPDMNIQLEGKSEAYPQGEQNVFDIALFEAKQADASFSQSYTDISLTMCYPYRTFLSTPLCVDLSKYYENRRDEVCYATPLAFQDQGAPVAITTVESDFLPLPSPETEEFKVKPDIRITITHIGNGIILAPTPQETLAQQCSLQGSEETLNTVHINATLGGKQLSCTPELVHLMEQEGTVFCTFPGDEGVLGKSNYETILTIELTYTYLETKKKQITITHARQSPGPTLVEERECQEGMIKVGESCLSLCEYCATHLSEPRCEFFNAYPLYKENGSSFSCSCTARECQVLNANNPLDQQRCIFNNRACDIGFCCAK